MRRSSKVIARLILALLGAGGFVYGVSGCVMTASLAASPGFDQQVATYWALWFGFVVVVSVTSLVWAAAVVVAVVIRDET